ncbi:MAG: S1C family serine protease [Candidatus Moraniibacteriota bacterium]
MKPIATQIKKTFKIIFVLALIFVIGGVGGVYFDQKVLPFLRTNHYFSRINAFRHLAENVTVIRTTEQITIKDEQSVSEVSSQASNATVNILSIVNTKDVKNKLALKNSQNGTGVIVTSDGVMVTYRGAIIENGASYKVFLYDGSVYDASLIGIDSFTDLAYLKITAPNLTAISFGDSAGVVPGKKLIAIGNTFGEYQNRFATGLLNNVNKTFNLAGLTLASTEKYEGVFEMDFSNQGEYLGGPVINYNGELIGLVGKVNLDNKAYFFQIPAKEIQKSLVFALEGKFETRPFFGAYYLSISKEYALANNLSLDRGALIFAPSGKQGLAIIAGSPAEKAGLKINDIVMMVGDKGVNLDNPLSNLLSEFKKGEKVELTVKRGSTELKIPVQL